MIDLSAPSELPLDARVIETELAHLWRQAAETYGGALARAASLTLLLPIASAELGERVLPVLGQVAAAHPCRVLLAVLSESEPRAHVAAHYRPGGAGRPAVYWEEVRLEGRRSALNRVLSAASALVLPNLPVQVWWAGATDLADELFQRIVEIGDRIVLDSSQFPSPLAALACYADYAEREHGNVDFADLTWRRLEPWRRLLAEFFDDPADRVFLNHIEMIRLTYDRSPERAPGAFAEPLLLLGWLASRLGWSIAAERTSRHFEIEEIVFDDGGRWVRVNLERRGGSEPPVGGLRGVCLDAVHSGQHARYAIERRGEQALTRAQRGDTQREAQVALPLPDAAELLREELAMFGQDRIYEASLLVVRELAQRAGVPARPL